MKETVSKKSFINIQSLFILTIVVIIGITIISIVLFAQKVSVYEQGARNIADAFFFAANNPEYCQINPEKCNVVINDNITIPPLVTTYSPELAQLAADLVARVSVVYAKGPVSSPNGLTFAGSLKSSADDVIGMIWTKGAIVDTIYVAFRGTSNLSEAISDIKYAQTTLTPYTGLLCHDGFITEYNSFRKQLLNAISLFNTSVPVFICGHSLGSALATFATRDIGTEAGGLQHPVYTYALSSPRVCNQSITGWEAFYRVQNSLDAVPALAFSVSPNLTNNKLPWYYTETGMPVQFTEQRFSLSNNHSLAAIQQNVM